MFTIIFLINIYKTHSHLSKYKKKIKCKNAKSAKQQVIFALTKPHNNALVMVFQAVKLLVNFRSPNCSYHEGENNGEGHIEPPQKKLHQK